jgi:hypothetical protein
VSEDKFWQLIEQSRQSTQGSLKKQTASLASMLNDLSESQLLDFITVFEENLRRAYRWDLWALATIAYLGCSDGQFEEFRSWLISRGREPFLRSLRDLEFATELVRKYAPDTAIGVYSEEFFLMPNKVFESRFGFHPYDRLPPELYLDGDIEPAGEYWDYSQLMERYARVCGAFSRQKSDFNQLG